MTNSPPANVSLPDFEPARVLVSGYDTVYLSLDVTWGGSSFLDYLERLKSESEDNKPSPGENIAGDDIDPWKFNVKPHGAAGYAYLLESVQCRAEIMNTPIPGSRPNVRILLGSETLWRMGLDNAIEWVKRHLKAAGATIEKIVPSRLDLCVDILLREDDWCESIKPMICTRAKNIGQYSVHRELSGFTIGSGAISARIYDKVKEITQKSRKTWFFDVWGIDEVPEGHRVVRVEFQLRREKIKGLGIDVMDDLPGKAPGLWAYCTQKWLQLKDNPGKHTTNQRKVLDWWKIIQAGFEGAQDAEPLVLEKVMRADMEMAFRQTFAFLSSYVAMSRCRHLPKLNGMITILDGINELYRLSEKFGLSDEKFDEMVRQKISRYHRSELMKGQS